MKLSKEKLASLSKKQKLDLIDAIEEKKRRRLAARPLFTPNAGQTPVIVSKFTKRIVISGNGAGKTAVAANEAIWAVRGYNPVTKATTAVPAKIVVVLDAPEKVADVWLPELRKWAVIEEEQLHKRGKPYVSEITFDNGSSLRFMFALQEAMAFESLETDFVIIDEPVPRPVWVALLRSGRKKNRQARFLMIGTPIAQKWLREYYVEWQKGVYPDTEFFKMSTEVNREHLSENYIEEYSRHLTESEKRTRLHGDFFNTDGLALAGLFKRERHVIPSNQLPVDWKTWPAVIAFDPHPNKPTHACLLLAGPQGQLVYAAERAAKQLPRDWAKWVKANWMQEYHVIDIISDNSGQADYSGGDGFLSFVEVLNREGVRVRATSYDEKKDDEFLTRLQEALYLPSGGDPKLTILMSCQGIVRDCENVGWKQLKGTEEYQNKLEIGNKDFLACLKYALAANLTFEGAKRKVIRPPGIQRQISSQPRKIGAFEERWQAEAAKKSAADDFDDW